MDREFFSKNFPRKGQMSKDFVITDNGLKKLKEELTELKNVRLKAVAERLKEAREFGDLSENAEYEAAKQEQAFVEGRIMRVESMIRNARIIEDSDYAADEVHLGASVKVKDTKGGSTLEFTLVGSTEADPKNGRLSNESPLGHALIGKKKGETIDVQTPRGIVAYKVESIGKKKAAAKKAS